jgi:hypothetical protein
VDEALTAAELGGRLELEDGRAGLPYRLGAVAELADEVGRGPKAFHRPWNAFTTFTPPAVESLMTVPDPV